MPKRSTLTSKTSRPDWAENPIADLPPWEGRSDAIIRDLEKRKNLIAQVRLLATMAGIENLPLTAAALSDTASRLHRLLIELHEGYAMTHANILDKEMQAYFAETQKIQLLLINRNKIKEKKKRKIKLKINTKKINNKVLSQKLNFGKQMYFIFP